MLRPPSRSISKYDNPIMIAARSQAGLIAWIIDRDHDTAAIRFGVDLERSERHQPQHRLGDQQLNSDIPVRSPVGNQRQSAAKCGVSTTLLVSSEDEYSILRT